MSRKSLVLPDSKQQVAILGGAGFIGTRLSGFLQDNGQTVRIGDIRQSESFPEVSAECDVRQASSVEEFVAGAGAIINLAAEHRDDVRPLSRYHEVNVGGAAHVCSAARLAGVKKIIFTSSVAVYGFHRRAVDEDGPLAPFNEYGKTKLEAEAVYQKWADEDPTRTLIIIRPTVVFGEGNRGNVYNLMRQIASGRFFMVGSGTNVKSMAYVGNLVAFIAHSLTMGPGIHIANYVDAPDMNTRDLILHINQSLGNRGAIRRIPKSIAMAGGHLLDLIARISGYTFPISAIRVRKFCETTQFKADRVPEWGFRPPTTLAEALAKTVAYEFGGSLEVDRRFS